MTPTHNHRDLVTRRQRPAGCRRAALPAVRRRVRTRLLAAAWALLAAATPAAATGPPDVMSAPSTGAERARHLATPTDGTWRLPGDGPVLRPANIPRSPWAAGHRGLDVGLGAGADVASPADGIVRFVGQVAGRGVLVVEHAGGLRSTLEPVAASTTVGTPVAAGAVVGALTTEPGHCAPRSCLHWGVRLGSTYIDPATLLTRPRIILLPPRA